ncbi:alpha-1,3-mannosyl-glycoprotein 2-beta-N-acetylglucosaminyltransferase [Bombyx mandarina]|uniref:Alpha-1,3-mannosyl-glycoprotein 2-beta-N-acetylglucosaminyltransferase n=2 Tax=Bombyx TaxID=7090 RepID=F8WLR8_BOMMO|nr:acetylglucosaminyltransferase [Bombyx mori]XP_012551817.2 acetylglucosaminyltransferase isoform X1 [Bombyx mori]XP_028028698.1 alpha-1,3-mannosyl-glycoprotein 2-beta-N-acetylglucosaminyltransferase [Bombyx mandarina]BAK55694.1 acetylglucosaminyltransferase [Bombyx mori]
MRLNVRKLLFVSCGVLLLWFIVSYSSIIELPRSITSKDTAADVENKLGRLQKKIDDQMLESKTLLQKVKNELKKKTQSKESLIQYSDEIIDGPTILPVLVIACDRVTVKRCLDNLVKFRPDKERFPIVVSQDCGHNATYQVIRSFTDADPSIKVILQPDLSEIPLPKVKVKLKGYYKIARHFKFALNHMFNTLNHEAVIIVEDDLDISPDFYEYFLGTYPLLQKDPSLWCISAWNDNGKKDIIDLTRPELLYRTDFFPGLGWMLRKEMWTRLEPIWPPAFFDDWLRNPVNTQGRACIRPEISRTYSFGKIGVSQGLFFDKHLRKIQLNLDYVEFTKLNLTYLLKDNYDETLTSTVYSLPEVMAEDVILGEMDSAVRVSYSNAKSYQRAAKKLGLMDDFRSGVPRTAYRGIVTCFIRGRRVYLAPDYQWTKYDPSWG